MSNVDLTSALYWLVWHLGMPIAAARTRYFNADPTIRRYWAIRGRVDLKRRIRKAALFGDTDRAMWVLRMSDIGFIYYFRDATEFRFADDTLRRMFLLFVAEAIDG